MNIATLIGELIDARQHYSAMADDRECNSEPAWDSLQQSKEELQAALIELIDERIAKALEAKK